MRKKVRTSKENESGVVIYSVLVDDVDDDDEPAIFLAVVDEGNPPDLNVSLESL